MGTGSSKGTAKIVSADEKLNDNQAPNRNTTSNAEGNGINKPSTNAESQNGTLEGKSSLNNSNTNHVALRSSQEDGEGNAQDVEGEKNPQLEPRLTSTKKHYQSLKEALDSGNLMTSAALEHAKALIDVYSKCKKRSVKSSLTDFAVTLEIPRLVYEIIVDRRTNYPEITTWDRKPRKEQEKEQGENEETTEADDNQVTQVG